MSQHSESASHDSMQAIQQNVLACMQCGICSGSCANAFAMDLTPRQMWRLVQLGEKREIFESKTFFLCSACYYCTLRCPRGLPLTETMGALKRLAMDEGVKGYEESTRFYRAFMRTMQRYGRMRETEFINRYFLSMIVKKPLLPLTYLSLALKLFKKGKVSLKIPQFFGPGRLDKLFQKVEELEARK